MDSLTQIVLGASVGEVCLGKKLGNRAMIWGGIAGTIPDLDVVSTFFYSELENLAFHRGITHSIFFAVTACFLFGYLVYKLYESPHYKWIATFIHLIAIGILLPVAKELSSRLFPDSNLLLMLSYLSIIGLGVFVIYRKYFGNKKLDRTNASFKQWTILFFWAFITHSLLDCFTVYGTQLFMPFSDYRVAFSTISVADPAYTVPFLSCLIIASFFKRGNPKRTIFNLIGLALSSAYLCFTILNKTSVNNAFKTAMAKEGLEYTSYVTSPTILNNILWSFTAESKDVYYMGTYSLFDEHPISFVPITKNHDLLDDSPDDMTIEVLSWFSNGFYSVYKLGEDTYQLSDLRFGSFSGKAKSKDDFIFRFIIKQFRDCTYELISSEGGPPKGEEKSIFPILINRIKGKQTEM